MTDEQDRLLPQGFVDAYEALFFRAFDDGSGSSNHPLSGKSGEVGVEPGKVKGQWRVSSSEETQFGKKNSGDRAQTKRVGKTSKFLKNEQAFKFKALVDKKLRRISREIIAFIEEREIRNRPAIIRTKRGVGISDRKLYSGYRICMGKCKKFGESDWNFCARCGGLMRDPD